VHHALQMGSIVLPAFVLYAVGSARREKGVRGFHATLADKERALDHFRRVAPSYDALVSRGLLGPLRRRERAAVLQLAAFDDPLHSVIDVGAGNGFYARKAKQAGLYVCATDAVDAMTEGLRGAVDAVLVADIETLSSPRTYDRVICAGVLDFVALPDLAMKNLASLVAPGGRLVLLVSCRSFGGLLYRLEKLFIGVRVNLFEKQWLIEHAARHGLTLRAYLRPLPWNAALSFERPPLTSDDLSL
jgi:SAM-dependent methyltransferase